MTRSRALLIQTLVELALPVIGYFYWRWNLTFILLYYLLDVILVLGLSIAKTRKRLQFIGDSERAFFYRWYIPAFAAFAVSCILIYSGLRLRDPSFQLFDEMYRFWSYTDMGMQQGYLLVPLILLNGYMLYRQEFLLTAKFRELSVSQILRPVFDQALVLLACSAIFVGVSYLFTIPELAVIGFLVISVSAYRWFFLRTS